MPLRGSSSLITQSALQLHKHPMHQRYQMDKMIYGDSFKPGPLRTRQPYEADARLVRGRPSIFGPASSLKRKIKSPETALAVESGLKSGVKFWYGETPKEYATGEIIGYGLGLALGGGYKVAKGIYQGGKSIYKALRHADSMVPGNRPPRPRTPVAPNPADVEGRRNLLKGGALVVTGGAVAKMTGATDALVAGVNKLRGGKIAAKTFVAKSFPNIHYYNMSDAAKGLLGKSSETGLSLASDYLGKQIADTMPNEFFEKIVAKNKKTLEEYRKSANKKGLPEELKGLPTNVEDARKQFRADAVRRSHDHFSDDIRDIYADEMSEYAAEVGDFTDAGFEHMIEENIMKYYDAGEAHNLGSLIDDTHKFDVDEKTFERIKKEMLNKAKWQAFRYSQNKAPFA